MGELSAVIEARQGKLVGKGRGHSHKIMRDTLHLFPVLILNIDGVKTKGLDVIGVTDENEKAETMHKVRGQREEGDDAETRRGRGTDGKRPSQSGDHFVI